MEKTPSGKGLHDCVGLGDGGSFVSFFFAPVEAIGPTLHVTPHPWTGARSRLAAAGGA